MIDIAVKGVRKAFEEDREILKGLSFDINEGERVGLLGKNGAGKTTLMRIITGELESDTGEVVIPNGKRAGLISQIPRYPAHFTAEDVLKTAHERVYAVQKRLERLDMTASADAAREYDRLTAAMQAMGGYDIDYERDKVANGLNIPPAMRAQLFSSLSGGEKTRVNLARLILEKTDILLLDEPTNHLDMKATEWLEEYLLKFKGTVLTISHDRYFLDRVVDRIIEIVDGRAEFYSGNYSFYIVEKQARYEEQLERWQQEQKEAKRLEAAADRLAQWGTGNRRLMHKAEAMYTRAEKAAKTERPDRDSALRARFSEKKFRGDEVLVIKDLKKSFGERRLFEGVDLLVRGGERIALIGDNGSGKTTFLNLITGREKPDGGVIRTGPTVKTAYLEQHVRFDNMARTAYDTVLYETGCTPQTARDRLGAFKFSGEDAFRYVSVMSGGELSRLRLCILMRDDINLLILDEPTNHLDVNSREWIEQALEDYSEALLFVSHDRYFINRFATRIWLLEDGRITDWPYSFEEFRRRRAIQTQTEKNPKEKPRRAAAKTGQASAAKRAAAVEREIKAAEEKIKSMEADIELYSTDYEKLDALFTEKAETEKTLEALYEQWYSLTE
jgi:ATPase subunit of ABC transporter with duplicated ATPase domains